MSARHHIRWTRLAALAALALLLGCGSIAGNPKKPTKPDAPAPSTVYALPLLDFSLPSEVTAEDAESGLFLAQPVLPGQGQGILRSWGKRFDRAVKQVNALSERVNAGLDEDSEEQVIDGEGGGEDGTKVLTFGKAAAAKGLSGKVRELSAEEREASGLAFEAVVCTGGKPTARLRWSEDQKAVSLTRDFAPKTSESDDGAFEWVADMTFATTKEGETTLTLSGQGAWDAATDEAGKDGSGLVERAVATRLASGELRLKTVADHYDEVPDDYDGDAYLVGRLVPLAEEAGEASGNAGKPRFGTAFVAYFKNFGGPHGPCSGGFDEDAADLWAPDLSGDGPRWCLGKPLGAKRFLTKEALHRTLEALEPVGLLPKAELHPVALSEEVTCEL